jgi:C1A family cysteine protease
MLVVGYISGKGFIIKNSWGSSWGDGGFCIMKPEYLAWSRTQDLWVPTKGTTFR